MRLLQSAVSEIIGLFVDDWLFASLLVAWVALFGVFGAHTPHPPASTIFFAGIAALVLVFVAWKARARQRGTSN